MFHFKLMLEVAVRESVSTLTIFYGSNEQNIEDRIRNHFHFTCILLTAILFTCIKCYINDAIMA